MFSAIFFLIFLGLSYLSGSVCSAVIVCNLCKLPDPRAEGSKNPGATNVLRLAGKKYAITVLLADILKGFLPVIIARLFGFGEFALGCVCLAAVIGHLYPYFFDFKGGKGVATALGALLGINFSLGLITVVLWILIAIISRYSSLASIISLLAAPLISLKYHPSFIAFLPLLVMSLFVVYRHQENFTRLQKGTESKIDFSKK
jgi:glycerol-3-phosphate acyltransferase PlsY